MKARTPLIAAGVLIAVMLVFAMSPVPSGAAPIVNEFGLTNNDCELMLLDANEGRLGWNQYSRQCEGTFP